MDVAATALKGQWRAGLGKEPRRTAG